jgi:uncharacterized membrane protein (UPF0127 family)
MRFRLFCVLFIASAALAACTPRKPAAVKISVERPGAAPVSLAVELARTNEERARGLMGRKSLRDGEGMLFMFERDETLSFWMKDTVIPLSIAFIASDGRITEIRDMRPLDLSAVQSRRSVRYALEVPQGWFERTGIRTGDVLQLPD